MPLPAALESLRDRPGMNVTEVSFSSCMSFILGYDAALAHGPLVGLHEWLTVRLNGADNFAWPAQLARAVSASSDTPEDIEASLARAFATLEEFFDARDRHGGLRRIFHAYEKWLRKQSSYGPKSPRWIPP